MKFKIMKDKDGYYPFVKHWIGWRRIGVHTDGYGLYNNYSYSLPFKCDAMKIIDAYEIWYSDKKDKPVEVWSSEATTTNFEPY